MNKILVFASLFILWTTSQSQQESYTVANVSFDDFKTLVQEVESVREKKLISFDEFLDLSKKRNTVILDARSREKYNNKHIKGAVNLPFTEFTQENLAEVIPNKRTRVLIYCNNNFLGDQINFGGKIDLI
ncbi:MAG: rhodanese-like domain-containing protein, partial [Bacteroidota bacterium]